MIATTMKYALGPPTPECAAAVFAQLTAGHRYRNALTEIDRAARAAERDLYSADSETSRLEAAAKAAAAAVETIVAAHAAERAE
jgi:hypothetical protein